MPIMFFVGGFFFNSIINYACNRIATTTFDSGMADESYFVTLSLLPIQHIELNFRANEPISSQNSPPENLPHTHTFDSQFHYQNFHCLFVRLFGFLLVLLWRSTAHYSYEILSFLHQILPKAFSCGNEIDVFVLATAHQKK